MNKGKLVVIEGCDGAGKETQTKMLMENLVNKGLKVATLAFPRYTVSVGGKLLALALGKNKDYIPEFSYADLDPYAASLPYAMDRYMAKDEINKLLDENDVVILDRYYTANILHQGAKFEDVEGRNKYINDIEKIELEILGIPEPDLVLYLHVPYEVTVKRIQARSESGVQAKDAVEANLEYIKRSNEKGISIAEYCGWSVISGTLKSEAGEEVELSREEVQEAILHKFAILK